MSHDFRYLLTPIRVGPVTLKNRIFSTGRAEALAEDGKPKGTFQQGRDTVLRSTLSRGRVRRAAL